MSTPEIHSTIASALRELAHEVGSGATVATAADRVASRFAELAKRGTDAYPADREHEARMHLSRSCDGSKQCASPIHVHGCSRDTGVCTMPEQHGAFFEHIVYAKDAAEACDGSRTCTSSHHVHGCFSDDGNCDVPGEHGGAVAYDAAIYGQGSSASVDALNLRTKSTERQPLGRLFAALKGEHLIFGGNHVVLVESDKDGAYVVLDVDGPCLGCGKRGRWTIDETAEPTRLDDEWVVYLDLHCGNRNTMDVIPVILSRVGTERSIAAIDEISHTTWDFGPVGSLAKTPPPQPHVVYEVPPPGDRLYLEHDVRVPDVAVKVDGNDGAIVDARGVTRWPIEVGPGGSELRAAGSEDGYVSVLDEPTRLLAIVEDDLGRRWLRWAVDAATTQPWILVDEARLHLNTDSEDCRRFAEIGVVLRVLTWGPQ